MQKRDFAFLKAVDLDSGWPKLVHVPIHEADPQDVLLA